MDSTHGVSEMIMKEFQEHLNPPPRFFVLGIP